MGVYVVFGCVGGVGVIGEYGQIVWVYQQFIGLVVGFQGVVLGDGVGGGQWLCWGGYFGGQVQVGLWVNVVVVGGNDYVVQVFMVDQWFNVWEYFLVVEVYGGLGVLQVVFEFGVVVYWVDWYDNGVGVQNGVVIDDELWGVLYEQYYLVVFFYVQVL